MSRLSGRALRYASAVLVVVGVPALVYVLFGAPEPDLPSRWADARAGITLTNNFAMMPAASVSGLYFAHPETRYFGVGRIGRDQVEDYARRKGFSVPEAEETLAANLGYAPEDC